MSFVNEPNEEQKASFREGVGWSPERKIVGSAAAVIVLWLAQIFVGDLEVPAGIEGAVAVLVAYFLPNKK